MRFSERQFNSKVKWLNCGKKPWRKKNSDAYSPLSSQNQHRNRGHCAGNKQEEHEKLMRAETGTVCMRPRYGAGVLEWGARLQGI